MEFCVAHGKNKELAQLWTKIQQIDKRILSLSPRKRQALTPEREQLEAVIISAGLIGDFLLSI